jgi:hypothetical protein
MSYSNRSLIHHPKFDRDCEEVFGSLEKADHALAELMYCISHNLAAGALIVEGVSSFFASTLACVVVVEELHTGSLLVRACISVGESFLCETTPASVSCSLQPSSIVVA